MRIVYTKHAAIDKFAMLERHKFRPRITKRMIREVIKNPEHEDTISDSPNIISSRSIDEEHILRVVWRKEGDIIFVITFHPAEQGRYYEKKTNKN